MHTMLSRCTNDDVRVFDLSPHSGSRDRSDPDAAIKAYYQQTVRL